MVGDDIVADVCLSCIFGKRGFHRDYNLLRVVLVGKDVGFRF